MPERSKYPSQTREAVRERMRVWREKNKEKNRAYNRARWLADQHGITPEDFERMLQAQDGVCAICRQKCPLQNGQLCVDHCHKTGRVRALLCRGCNSGLGFFRENPEALIRAAEYLAEHTKPEAA